MFFQQGKVKGFCIVFIVMQIGRVNVNPLLGVPVIFGNQIIVFYIRKIVFLALICCNVIIIFLQTQGFKEYIVAVP